MAASTELNERGQGLLDVTRKSLPNRLCKTAGSDVARKARNQCPKPRGTRSLSRCVRELFGSLLGGLQEVPEDTVYK